MKRQTLQLLLEKKRQGLLSKEEQEHLDDWEAKLDQEEGLLSLYSEEEQMQMRQRMWDHIGERTKESGKLVHLDIPPKRKRWPSIAAAAILILAGAAVYQFFQSQSTKQIAVKEKPNQSVVNEITPGTSGAILTLANGEQVVLDTAAAGALAIQGKTQILNHNGELRYNTEGASASSEPLINTLSTPNGRQYQLVLSDGTRVWLNAGSSISYPTAFTGKFRSVKVTGETYFEVAKDKDRPFRVKINESTDIEVLGTHFNVNAYSDEAGIATTLLEGAVIMRSGNDKRSLEPGQQVLAKTDGKLELNTKADAQQAIAWKNGVFNFHRMQLKGVMRQLARWYDITVVYEKYVPDITIGGKMGRDLNLSQALEILSEMSVHYRLEAGRKLVVLP